MPGAAALWAAKSKHFKTDTHHTQRCIQCWTESIEENTDDFKIFRPCDFKEYPRTRFRFKMILKENNECDWLFLAPNDAHEMKRGAWYFDSEKRELRIAHDGETAMRLEVVSMGADLIKVINN